MTETDTDKDTDIKGVRHMDDWNLKSDGQTNRIERL